MIKLTDKTIDIKLEISIPFPRKYRGGGVALFRKNNGIPEVLLGLRANHPGKGKWSFPGGGAERKEKLSKAALREFKEETGIRLYEEYITRTTLFKIKSFFFDWVTLLIETDQSIHLNPNYEIKNNINKHFKLYGGEFLSMRWIPVDQLGELKLHRWVKDVIKLYQTDKMKKYVATNPENKRFAVSKRAKYLESKKQRAPLFDLAEMILFKTDPDGTKYFKPKYKIPSCV